jgi:hypothetical protein
VNVYSRLKIARSPFQNEIATHIERCEPRSASAVVKLVEGAMSASLRKVNIEAECEPGEEATCRLLASSMPRPREQSPILCR